MQVKLLKILFECSKTGRGYKNFRQWVPNGNYFISKKLCIFFRFWFPFKGRTEIYQHSRRDLVRATRKIRHANEPVVHTKHQLCNSNACSAQYML